ncbi:hypothetical protein BASA50_011194 [Batrachochytrium salamandrivorans]|uniref:Transmembrane protein 209 n=1 Tax=Batrachochytrium salamandrivorans TaxID=1357716 RepID=A0ABQ8EVZ3_9FUNG|nr:hypothetical protein BASA50_011194 [Batrachochytrium salamandrivorans]KAH6603000.1 hypothetical protein BASA61_000530 [Batrachochytrium salamandrivorans]
MAVTDTYDHIPTTLTPVKRRTAAQYSYRNESPNRNIGSPINAIEGFSLSPSTSSVRQSPLAPDSNPGHDADATIFATRCSNTDQATAIKSLGSNNQKTKTEEMFFKSTSILEMLQQRAYILLSDVDRFRFKANAAALCLIFILATFFALSGYDIYFFFWPSSLISGGVLFIVSVLIWNIAVIVFKFLWATGTKSADTFGHSINAPVRWGAQQPVESRGEAWSPVRPLVSPRKVHTSPRSGTVDAFNSSSGVSNSHSPLPRGTIVKPFMLRGSPMRNEVPMINDRFSLFQLLDDSESQSEQPVPTGTQNRSPYTIALGALASSTPSISRFQHAVKPTLNLVDKEIIEDGLVVRDPSKTLKEWKTAHYIDEWAEAIRKWLAIHLLDKLVERIGHTDEALTKAGLSHLVCSIMSPVEGVQIRPPGAKDPQFQTNPAQPTGMFGAAPRSSMFGTTAKPPLFATATIAQPMTIPQTLQQLADRLSGEPVVQERITLEGYLAVGKFSCREYILDRIKNLATGSCVAQYQWDGGQNWHNRVWNHDNFPSDAEIIMHLFCKYLDEKLRILEPHKHQGFSEKYFLPAGAKPSAISIYMIREQSKWPAHYQLVVENIIWDIYPNRNNLFHTLAMFIYCVKVISSGYIGLLYIGGVATQLLDVVAQGPIVSRFDSPRKARMGNTPASNSSLKVAGVTSTLGDRSTPYVSTPKRLLKF